MSQSESCLSVWDWLCVLHLEQYSEAFQSAGLETLPQCRCLTADQLDQMGITMPGHQRRILASLSKTHCNRDTQSDTHSHVIESVLRVETSHTKVLQRERPVPKPLEVKPLPRQRDEEMGPVAREREKPVPKERQVSRMKVESGDGEEKKSASQKRQIASGQEEERNGGRDGERDKPVPKERTKFRPSGPVESPPSLLLASTSDIALPPVPPRSNTNCPPQRFTSALSPTPPARTPASPKRDINTDIAPPVQNRSVYESSAPSRNPTHASIDARPETLTIQSPAQILDNDEGRKTSPVSLTGSLSYDRNAPALPPKAGGVPKGPPPLPQRLPAQSPSSDG